MRLRPRLGQGVGRGVRRPTRPGGDRTGRGGDGSRGRSIGRFSSASTPLSWPSTALGPGRPGGSAGNNFAVRRRERGVLDRSEIHETDVAGALAGRPGAIVAGRGGCKPGTSGVIRSARRSAIGSGSAMRTAGSAPGLVRWERLAGFLAGPAILGVQVAQLTGS